MSVIAWFMARPNKKIPINWYDMTMKTGKEQAAVNR
jgi:hypothetical protein